MGTCFRARARTTSWRKPKQGSVCTWRRNMPFVFKKVLEHGSTNAIVVRLGLQTLEILKQCNASKDIQEKVGDLYMNSLQKKLLRCWEIEERFKKEFAAAVEKYKPPAAANAP